MKRLPALAVASSVIFSFSTPADAGQRQTEEELNALIPGSTVDGKMAAGGTIIGSSATRLSQKGPCISGTSRTAAF